MGAVKEAQLLRNSTRTTSIISTKCERDWKRSWTHPIVAQFIFADLGLRDSGPRFPNYTNSTSFMALASATIAILKLHRFRNTWDLPRSSQDSLISYATRALEGAFSISIELRHVSWADQSQLSCLNPGMRKWRARKGSSLDSLERVSQECKVIAQGQTDTLNLLRYLFLKLGQCDSIPFEHRTSILWIHLEKVNVITQ